MTWMENKTAETNPVPPLQASNKKITGLPLVVVVSNQIQIWKSLWLVLDAVIIPKASSPNWLKTEGMEAEGGILGYVPPQRKQHKQKYSLKGKLFKPLTLKYSDNVNQISQRFLSSTPYCLPSTQLMPQKPSNVDFALLICQVTSKLPDFVPHKCLTCQSIVLLKAREGIHFLWIQASQKALHRN